MPCAVGSLTRTLFWAVTSHLRPEFLSAALSPKGTFTCNVYVHLFLWSLPACSWKCKWQVWTPSLFAIEPVLDIWRKQKRKRYVWTRLNWQFSLRTPMKRTDSIACIPIYMSRGAENRILPLLHGWPTTIVLEDQCSLSVGTHSIFNNCRTWPAMGSTEKDQPMNYHCSSCLPIPALPAKPLLKWCHRGMIQFLMTLVPPRVYKYLCTLVGRTEHNQTTPCQDHHVFSKKPAWTETAELRKGCGLQAHPGASILLRSTITFTGESGGSLEDTCCKILGLFLCFILEPGDNGIVCFLYWTSFAES